jgi:dTDP-4-dehydrorhamnose reductase
MRVLITGANGMLGRDLLHAFRGGAELFPLDHAACEITNFAALDRVFGEIQPQIIINCAAYTDVDGCERNLDLAMAVNGQGAGNVARAAERIGARVFHISTDYVFDGADRWDGRGATPDYARLKPYVETDAINAISMYAKSKLAGEVAVLAGGNPGRHLSIRTSWLYGASRVNFVDRVVEQALKGGPVKAVTDQISCLTWTRDLARGIAALVARQPTHPATGILHLAGAGMSTRLENAAHIVNWLKHNGRLKGPVELVGTSWTSLALPAKRPSFSAMVSARLNELGIEALPDWRASLDEYLSLRIAA